jgi:hypothetical protein
MRAMRILIFLAVLFPTVSVALARQHPSEFEADLTRRLKYRPGKEIMLDASVGRLQFENIRVEAREKKNGTLMKVWVAGYSKASRDYDVTIRITFEDGKGKVLGTAMGRDEFEEDEDGTIKAQVLIPDADMIEAVTLEISAGD